MSKREFLEKAWERFVVDAGDEAASAWNDATALATKRDLVLFLAWLAGREMERRVTQQLSVAQKGGGQNDGYLAVPDVVGKAVPPC
jgi:hypothetical protein